MLGKKNIHSLSWIIFVMLQNFIFFGYFIIPLMFKKYGQMAIYAYPILLGVAFLLTYIMPKKLGEIKYFKMMKESKIIKTVFIISQFLIIMLLFWASYRLIIMEFFYQMTWIPFILALVFVAIYVSTNNVNVTINATTFPFLIGLFLILLPFFLSHNIRDYTYLLPLYVPKLDFTFLLILYIIFDGISMIFLNEKTQKPLKRHHIFIALAISLTLCFLEQLNILVICGLNYIADSELIGFFTFYIQDTITYIGNLNYIYVFLVPLIICFKCGLSLSMIKEAINWKSKKWKEIVLGLIFCLIIVIMNENVGFMIRAIPYLISATIVLLSVIYIFFIINRSDAYAATF